MSIDIILDKPSGEYLVGELVSGTVQVCLNKPKKIRKVALDIKGKEKCYWTETRRRNHRDFPRHSTTFHDGERRRIKYRAERELFFLRLVLREEPEEFVLPVGDHHYRFEFRLPNNLPGNMKGMFGEIKYVLKAFVDRPMAFDYSTKMPITVIPLLDLKLTANARKRMVFENRKTIGICCTSGYIRFTITAPKSGYTCMETIPFHIEIENSSNTDVYETDVTIQKFIKYTAHHPHQKTKTEDYTVVQQKWGTEVPARSGRKSFDVTIPLVSTQPTTLDTGELIKISYKVLVTCRIRGWHLNISGEVLLIIGSVSLEEGENIEGMSVLITQAGERVGQPLPPGIPQDMSVLGSQKGERVLQPLLTPEKHQPSAPSAGDIGWAISKN